MSNVDILAFGCAVSFIAVGGAYVLLRERYLEPFRQAARSRQRRSASSHAGATERAAG